MSEYRVATRYAKSLLELAKEQQVLDAVHNDMLLFSKTCEENRNLLLMLRNPIINHDKKLAILKAIFKDKVNKLTFAIFDIITRKNRENILFAISTEFHVRYNNLVGIGIANVATAFDLTNDLKISFKNIAKKLTGKNVELKEKVDEDMIGGFILRIDGLQIDNSIKNKLNKLKMHFKITK
ncbi:MAG: ATP synthase F1 subunit delta [Bacteroidetes bacterium]|nr:ATP synthase F1 subunit delta [Bacteroidota bacterium]